MAVSTLQKTLSLTKSRGGGMSPCFWLTARPGSGRRYGGRRRIPRTGSLCTLWIIITCSSTTCLSVSCLTCHPLTRGSGRIRGRSKMAILKRPTVRNRGWRRNRGPSESTMKSSISYLNRSISMKFKTLMILRVVLTISITTNTLRSIRSPRTGVVSPTSIVKPCPKKSRNSMIN